MAVTKIWAIHDSVSRVLDYCANPDKTKLSDLDQVLIYAANKAKTLDENEQQYAVSGINCSTDTAAEEMAATQRRFGKTDGNVAYHAYQSFKTGEVTAEECHRIGVETARRLWGCGSPVETSDCFDNQKHRPSRQARQTIRCLWQPTSIRALTTTIL